ncbi:MAG: signal peptidase II [Elusimicrobia bacterium]|nr:signal peptidase II [Elusimicrobiota bacterium]
MTSTLPRSSAQPAAGAGGPDIGALILNPAALLLIFALDRATKLWAINSLAPRACIPVLPFLRLTYVENTGAAFGVGRGGNLFFVFLTAALLAALLVWRRSWPRDEWRLRWGFLLVAGGALGNLYDRIAYRFVVDFLDLRVWPVFNVADSCVTVGACLLAWGLYRLEKRKPAP